MYKTLIVGHEEYVIMLCFNNLSRFTNSFLQSINTSLYLTFCYVLSSFQMLSSLVSQNTLSSMRIKLRWKFLLVLSSLTITTSMYTSQITVSSENIHFHSEYSLKNDTGNQILHIIYMCIFSHRNSKCQISSSSPAKLFFWIYPHEKGKTSCLSNSTPKTRLQNGGDQWQVLHFLLQGLDPEFLPKKTSSAMFYTNGSRNGSFYWRTVDFLDLKKKSSKFS